MELHHLDAQIQAVVPILGVSVGRKDDKATWRVDYASPPTPATRAQVQAILDGFDFHALPPPDPKRAAIKATADAVAADNKHPQAIRDLAQALSDYFA